jgi:hypothetical protein
MSLVDDDNFISIEDEIDRLEREKHIIEKSIKKLESKDTERGRKRPDEIRKRKRDFERPSSNRSGDQKKRERLNRSYEHNDSNPDGDSMNNSVKPKITSAVISLNPIPVIGEKPTPSLNVEDKQLKQRNKKMLGVILGTLNKFQKDMSSKNDATERREQLEQKVEAKVQEEQDKLREQNERQLKELTQKAEQLNSEIMRRKEEKEFQLLHKQWKSNRLLLSGYIKTKSKPSIYYLPANNNEKTAALLDEARKSYLEPDAPVPENDRMAIDVQEEQPPNQEPSSNRISSVITTIVDEKNGGNKQVEKPEG